MLVVSVGAFIVGIALVVADGDRRAHELELIEYANLAERVDDLAVSVLHLEPALRAPDDLVTAVSEDIDDEREIVVELTGELGIPPAIAEPLEASAESAQALTEAPGTHSYVELRTVSYALQDQVDALYSAAEASDDQEARSVQSLAVEQLRLVSDHLAADSLDLDEYVARAVDLGIGLESVIDDTGGNEELIDAFDIVSSTAAPDFETFDMLTEVVSGIDDVIGEVALQPVPDRRPFLVAAGLIAALSLFGLVHQIRRTRSARHVYQSTLRYKAEHDELTGLVNRSQLKASFDSMMGSTPAGGGIMLLDLDGFKQVNDHNGHHVGDLLLRGVAERLRSFLGADGRALRLGGDEFVVFSGNVESVGELVHQAELLLEVLSRPYEIEDAAQRVGVSIGVVFTADRRASVKDLLRDADAALFVAKTSGRGRVVSGADPTGPATAGPTSRQAPATEPRSVSESAQ